MLNLDTPELEHRTNFIFYASKDFIVYKDEMSIVKASCSGEVLARVPCPLDFHYYDVKEQGDDLLFVFGGKTFINLKSTDEVTVRELETGSLGFICTPILPLNDLVYFGTKTPSRLQFVGFNFEENQRQYQSSSWNLSNFSYLGINDDTFFGILDKVVIVNWHASGKTLWSRTETDLIDKTALPYKDGLLYICQEVLKHVVKGKAKAIKIPLLRPSQLLSLNRDTLYLQGNDKDIFSCDLANNRINWTIQNHKPVTKWVFTKAKKKNTIVDAAVLVTETELMVLDVTNGHYLYSLPCSNVNDIRLTEDNILIQKQNNTTDILAEG